MLPDFADFLIVDKIICRFAPCEAANFCSCTVAKLVKVWSSFSKLAGCRGRALLADKTNYRRKINYPQRN